MIIFQRYTDDPNTSETELVAHNKQPVEVLVELETDESEVGEMFRVQFEDGHEADAFAEELFYDPYPYAVYVKDRTDLELLDARDGERLADPSRVTFWDSETEELILDPRLDTPWFHGTHGWNE